MIKWSVLLFSSWICLGGIVAQGKTVVSLTPAITAMLVELKAEKNLVGITSQDPLKQVPTVGSFLRISQEAIIRLNPELVIYQAFQKAQMDFLARLSQIKLLEIKITNIDSIFAAAKKISRELNIPLDKYLSYKRSWRSFLYKAKIKKKLKFLALVEYTEGFQQIFALGKSSYLSEMLEEMGYENMLDSQRDYFRVSQEIFYQKEKPDLILNFSLKSVSESRYFGMPVINLCEKFLTIPSLDFKRKGEFILNRIAESKNN